VGLQQYGFAAVIAPSFAEIFYSNAMNNRLLLVQLERAEVNQLLALSAAPEGGAAVLQIDIGQQKVFTPTGQAFSFPLGARHKRMVIDGMDTVDLTLAALSEIEAFERAHFARRPWAAVM